MLDSSILIERYTARMTEEDFRSDWRRLDAVVRRLEIIGEAPLRAAVERALRDAGGNAERGNPRTDHRASVEPAS